MGFYGPFRRVAVPLKNEWNESMDHPNMWWNYFNPKQLYEFVINAVMITKLDYCAVSYWAAIFVQLLRFTYLIVTAHCYDKICKETELIQEKIQQELGLDPVDKEVIVLYEGEKGERPNEYWNGKRIVEMERPRPMWFSKNLMQKTTQPAATTKEVKPDNLG